MTPRQKVKLNSLIQKVVAAEIKASWTGTLMDDDEREDVKAEAKEAHDKLRQYIESLTK